ncbi:MAG: IS1182 family transposase [Saprospiraceae bacterium]
MAKPVFKELPLSKPSLFPTDIFERIGKDHPVRLVDMLVDKLDLSILYSRYKGGGASSYHPKMMLKVLFYAYLNNTYSCRKIEKALEENIHFMWLSGNSTPDFRTINNFRGKRLKDIIMRLFGEVVKLLKDLDCISLEVQYIDGTKIEATSNRYTFVWRKSVERYKSDLDKKLKVILADIESQIQSDNQEENTLSLPQEIDSETLKKKVDELNEKLKKKDQPNKEAKSQLKKINKEFLPRLQKYEAQLENLGDRNSYSKTDLDATFMRMKDDHLGTAPSKPAYNAQISTENQFVTNFTIHQTPGDTTTFINHLQNFEALYGLRSKEIVADAAYGSQENYAFLFSQRMIPYVKFSYYHKEQKKSFKENLYLAQNLKYNKEEDYFLCPSGQPMLNIGTGIRKSSTGFETTVINYEARNCEGCQLRENCHKSEGNRQIEINTQLNEYKEQVRELLKSEKGIKHRKKRPIEPESVFGQLKYNNKFSRFTFRGLDKVILEFGLMVIGHNLRKMALFYFKITFLYCEHLWRLWLEFLKIQNSKSIKFQYSY